MPRLRASLALAGLIAVVATPIAPARAGQLFHCTAAVTVADLRLLETPGLALLDVDLEYPAASAELLGSGAAADCVPGDAVSDAGAVSTYFDDDEGTLSIRFEGEAGVPEIAFPVAVCRLDAPVELLPGDFSITVNEARFPDGSSFRPGTPDTDVGDVSCFEATTTTTTSTTSTTSSTTTLPGPQQCADVDDSGRVTATDCLAILLAAVGLGDCDPVCICDPSGDGMTVAGDALICLLAATDQEPDLACDCG